MVNILALYIIVYPLLSCVNIHLFLFRMTEEINVDQDNKYAFKFPSKVTASRHIDSNFKLKLPGNKSIAELAGKTDDEDMPTSRGHARTQDKADSDSLKPRANELIYTNRSMPEDFASDKSPLEKCLGVYYICLVAMTAVSLILQLWRYGPSLGRTICIVFTVVSVFDYLIVLKQKVSAVI